MGRKRSNQWQIEPDEAGAADHGSYPNEPREAALEDRRFSPMLESDLRWFRMMPPHVLDPRVRRLLRRSRRAGRSQRG